MTRLATRPPVLTHEETHKAERSLKLSTLEGSFWGAMVGVGEHFTGAYAVTLRSSSFEIGLLAAVPTLFSAVGNMTSARFARWFGSRKAVVVLFAFLQALVWLPILALGWLDSPHRPLIFVGLLALYTGFGAAISPCWNSVMAEVVPPGMRGRYFSRRSRIATLSTVAAIALGGSLLYYFRDYGLLGFAVAFGAAMAFRLVSSVIHLSMMELKRPGQSNSPVPLRTFLSTLHSTPHGRAMLLIMALNFGVHIASPQFTAYMLRDLGMGTTAFTVLQLLFALATAFTITHWGTTADRYGNRRMMLASGILVGIVPLLWLASPNVYYLAAVQAFTGFAWAGFNLTSANFLFDATTGMNRTAYLGWFNSMAALLSAGGPMLSGLLLPLLPDLLGSPFLALFALSGLLRLAAVVGFFRLVPEVRKVSQGSALEVFQVLVNGKPVHHTTRLTPIYGAFDFDVDPETEHRTERPEPEPVPSWVSTV